MWWDRRTYITKTVRPFVDAVCMARLKRDKSVDVTGALHTNVTVSRVGTFTLYIYNNKKTHTVKLTEMRTPWDQGKNVHIRRCSHLRDLYSVWKVQIEKRYLKWDQVFVLTIGVLHLFEVFTKRVITVDYFTSHYPIIWHYTCMLKHTN